MKVLYLLNHAGKAGTERYVETLVRYLSADGRVEPYFAYNEPGLLVERMQAMSVPCRQIEMRSPYDLPAAKVLANLCREWGIELIHTHYLRENYIAMLAKGRNKAIRSVYTNHFVLANSSLNRLSNRLMDRRQDRMIAVCNLGREQLVKNGWSRDKISVIFNAVDLDAWAGDRSDSTLRRELGIPEARFVMLCASRFAGDKGHKYLIDSVKRLTELCAVPFTLVLAGDGPLLEPTKAQVQELGLEDCVKFIGFRKDIKNLYKGSDLYVNSSQHEALSFLIIEAMAAGEVEAIGTDHAPHSPEDKAKGAPGMVGLETAFSVCYTKLCRQCGLPLETLSRMMSKGPAEILGLNKGLLAEGYDGDVVLVDLDNPYVVNKDEFAGKSHNTPTTD